MILIEEKRCDEYDAAGDEWDGAECEEKGFLVFSHRSNFADQMKEYLLLFLFFLFILFVLFVLSSVGLLLRWYVVHRILFLDSTYNLR